MVGVRAHDAPSGRSKRKPAKVLTAHGKRKKELEDTKKRMARQEKLEARATQPAQELEARRHQSEAGTWCATCRAWISGNARGSSTHVCRGYMTSNPLRSSRAEDTTPTTAVPLSTMDRCTLVAAHATTKHVCRRIHDKPGSRQSGSLTTLTPLYKDIVGN